MDRSRVFEMMKIVTLIACIGVFGYGWFTDQNELIVGSGGAVVFIFLRILWYEQYFN